MAKIGIGVTTYNRPECLAKWKEQIAKHTFMNNVLIYVAEDTDQDRQGIARRKNECLRALKDCDYIFLFDDDCYPINDGWIEFFINSGQEHLLFLDDRKHTNYGGFKNLRFFKDCGGVFMFMTKQAIQKVGALDEKFTVYGFEHCDYSRRIFGRHGQYICLANTERYLYSADYSDLNHKSSITDEEKKQHIRNNWDKFFKEPIKQIYIPL